MNKDNLIGGMHYTIIYDITEPAQSVLAKYLTWWFQDKVTYTGDAIEEELPRHIGNAMVHFQISTSNYAIKMFVDAFLMRSNFYEIPYLFDYSTTNSERDKMLQMIKNFVFMVTKDTALVERVEARFKKK